MTTDHAAYHGLARDFADGHIRAHTAYDEAADACAHRASSDTDPPCGNCVRSAARMLAVTAEMYEGGFDPDDMRHVGFAEGWWAGLRYGLMA